MHLLLALLIDSFTPTRDLTTIVVLETDNALQFMT